METAQDCPKTVGWVLYEEMLRAARLVSPFLQLLYRPEYPNPRTFPKCASTGLMGMSSKWIYGTSDKLEKNMSFCGPRREKFAR